MLYEYPDRFIVPITYINTSGYKDSAKDEKRKIKVYRKTDKKHKLKNKFRDTENSEDMINSFFDDNLISGNQKDYFLENINMYSDIDDEYAKNETKKK